MSSTDIEHRPAKKRRFFVDEPDDIPERQAPTSGDASKFTTSASSAEGQARSSQIDAPELEPPSPKREPQTFDVDTFRAFISEDVDLGVVQKMRVAANDDLERAINMYLDGSWKDIIT